MLDRRQFLKSACVAPFVGLGTATAVGNIANTVGVKAPVFDVDKTLTMMDYLKKGNDDRLQAIIDALSESNKIVRDAAVYGAGCGFQDKDGHLKHVPLR